jgi:hypothetical protein
MKAELPAACSNHTHCTTFRQDGPSGSSITFDALLMD